MIQPAVKSAVSSALTIASGADEMTAQTLPDKGFTAILARHSEAETDVAAALPAFDVGTPPPPIDLTGNLAGKTGGNSLPGELPDDAMDISLQDSETEEMHAEAGISPVPADGTLAIPILSIDRGRALRAVPTPTSSSTANPGSTSTPEPNVRATLGPADTLKPVARAADAAGKAAKQTDPKSAARPFPM
ncbi:MAG: hypothetical protein KUG65_02715, partial [Sphingomonadaceae bacterium]|nr:hypothetical protein [Sphingomonadaceae bacterium]